MSWFDDIARLLGGGPGTQGGALVGQAGMTSPVPIAGIDPQPGMAVGGGSTSGGATSSGVPGAGSVFESLFNSPDFRRQSLQSALMGAAGGLLKASGPSPVPTSFLSALGQGLQGAQQGMDTQRDRFTKDLLLGSQLDTAALTRDTQRGWQSFMQRLATPGGGAPGSPTTQTPASGAPGAGGGASPPNPNNPGNMIDGRGGFQTFNTPQEGVAAMIGNALRYGPQQTIAQIAQRWAPPDDGRNPMLRGNDPQQWARNVAAISGLPADQPIDLTNPQVALAFARGVHAAEKGQGAAFSPDVYQQGVQMALSRGAPQGVPRQTAQAPTGAGLTIPRPQTPQEVAALPPGTQFIAPDGSVRVR